MSFEAFAALLLAFAFSFLVGISNAYVIRAYDENSGESYEGNTFYHLTKRSGVPTIDGSKAQDGLIHGFLLYGGIALGAMAVLGLVMYSISLYFGKKETEAAKRRVTEQRFRARNVDFELMPLPQTTAGQRGPTRPSRVVIKNKPRRIALERIVEELDEDLC